MSGALGLQCVSPLRYNIPQRWVFRCPVSLAKAVIRECDDDSRVSGQGGVSVRLERRG